MEIIKADKNRDEQSFLNKVKIDIDVGVENDFEIQTSTENLCLNDGDYFYLYDTEYGGMVRDIEVDTINSIVKYQGRSFRGLLEERAIEPLSGNAYRTVTGNSTSIIGTLLAECDLDYLFKADSTNAVNIPSFKFDRYCTFLDGINKMLKSVGHRLKIAFRIDGNCYLGAVPIVDYSESIEFSEDGNIKFVIKKKKTPTHLLCLGGGELEKREVVNLYLQENGTIGNNEFYKGADKYTYIYDFVTSDNLREDGIAKFQELLMPEAIEMNIEDIDVELYDIVGGREYITDTYVSKEITQKIIVIENDRMTISYKVGED